MKAMVCEMCSSHDLVKDGDFYVCQNCGTKYTVEAAKKLMIEGVVEVKGSVAIDSKKQIENYISLLRIAAEGRDNDGILKYSEKIIELDPSCYEAYLYMAKSAGWESTLKQPMFDKALAYGKRAIELSQSDKKEAIAKEIFTELKKQIFALFGNALELPSDTSLYVGRIMQYWVRMVAEFPNLPSTTIIAEYREIEKLSNTKRSIPATPYFEDRLPVFVALSWQLYNDHQPYHKQLFGLLPKKIQEQINATDKAKGVTDEPKKESGCFVATAVYGSYDCPEVWTLMRYRDYTLAESWYGRAFIRTYYAVSPTLVKWFGDAEWFKKLLKPQLDRIVMKLKIRGLSDKPYADRDW